MPDRPVPATPDVDASAAAPIERRLFAPVPVDRLWQAITDPDELQAWFGATVEWDLRPGGRARFAGHDGSERRGQVTEVEPGSRLRFEWWPDDPDGGDDGASEVTYDLSPRPDGSGSDLVIREGPLATTPMATGAPRASSATRWTSWDTRLVAVWAGLAGCATAGRRR